MGKRNKTNSKVAVAYIRCSRDEQKLSPDAQRAAIKTWAAREGVQIAAWHVDHGVSSESDLESRAGLVAALADVKAHNAGLLVLLRRDRLARDSYVALTIERTVEKCGARVVTADGVANGDNPADAFMRSILDAVAAYELGILRSRTKAALAVKKAKGQRIGGIPYGYQLAVDGIHLEEHADEQYMLGHVQALRESGLTLRAIAAELRRDGFVSRRGRPIGKTQVARMLAS